MFKSHKIKNTRSRKGSILKHVKGRIFFILIGFFIFLQSFGEVPVNTFGEIIGKVITPNPILEESKLVKKYAGLLKLDEEVIKQNITLYKFIDSWMGTPYKWGGCDRGGIDCSCFIMTLFDQVFDINIKRTTFTQFYDNDISLFRNSSSFGLGDLIFFKTNISRETNRNAITHVGMYLANGYFIQSSSSGVNIGNLNATYWKNCFVAAGRLKDKYYSSARLAKNKAEVKDSKTVAVADQQNSDFDPVPYPEDLDELKGNYAKILGIDSTFIVVPEMFEYIDKLRYAPYVLQKECGKRMGESNCFIKGFFKDVLNLDINTTNAQITSQKQTARLKSENKPAAFDLILMKSNKRFKNYDITGIYLYNDHFVHVVDDEIVISSFQDSAYMKAVVSYYRIDQSLLKEGAAYIDSLRTDPELKKAYLEKVRGRNPLPEPKVETTDTTVNQKSNHKRKKSRKKKN